MSRFNKTAIVPARAVVSPVTTSPVPDTRTYQGAPAHTRDAKSDLFLLGVSNMTGERTFYESADARDARFTTLVTEVALADSPWLCGFLPWLRSVANMRSAPLTAAVEATRAMVAAGIPGSVKLLDSVLRRPDAPGEALAYHILSHGRRFPIPLKKACARAAVRMYTEKATVRYDTASHAFRFGHVIELCHPVPSGPQQSALFRACLDRAHLRPDPRYGTEATALPMLSADAMLRAQADQDPRVLLDTGRLQAAGWVFQDALPYAGGLVSKKELYETVIPLMGYEALLKNLAAFDRAGVSDDVAATVCARIADPYLVRRSQVMPFQMLAAFEAISSLRWGQALEKALQASVSNIPQLAGRTLALVDTSQSMTQYTMSDRSKMTVAKAAAVFAVALAYSQGDAQVYGFANSTFEHRLPIGGSMLRGITTFLARTGEVGHGTDITRALRDTYRGHDRVFVFTDEQSNVRFDPTIVPHHVPIYVFNLVGYGQAYAPSGGNVHALGGLNDATFTMVSTLESRKTTRWPWELPGAPDQDGRR